MTRWNKGRESTSVLVLADAGEETTQLRHTSSYRCARDLANNTNISVLNAPGDFANANINMLEKSG
jgi:hypothetical protein